ncbi:MAG: hypothetical protein JNM84_19180 [Planctomycetes bacterium]|nr:hypothetical protein [Planctomycetota bacterium]
MRGEDRLLDQAIDAESADLLSFVFEIAWFTKAQAQDRDLALKLLQALYSNAKYHVEPAWFVCDDFARITPCPQLHRTRALTLLLSTSAVSASVASVWLVSGGTISIPSAFAGQPIRFELPGDGEGSGQNSLRRGGA